LAGVLAAGPVGESGTAGAAAGVVVVGVEGVVASETVVSSPGVAGCSITVTLFAEIFPPLFSPPDVSFFVLG